MIIHQIWIGKNARPTIWMDTVKNFCDKFDHEYMLWTEDNVSLLEENHSFEGVNELIDELDENDTPAIYAGMCDVYRLLLLFLFGGLYLDADMVVLNEEKLNDLINSYSDKVILGWENDEKSLIANSVIAAPIHDKFIEKCLHNISSFAKKNVGHHVWLRTGPKFITDMYQEYDDKRSIKVVEKTTFYPISWHGVKDIDVHTQKTIELSLAILVQYGYSTNNFREKIDIYEHKKQMKIARYIIIGLAICFVISLIFAFIVFKIDDQNTDEEN